MIVNAIPVNEVRSLSFAGFLIATERGIVCADRLISASLDLVVYVRCGFNEISVPSRSGPGTWMSRIVNVSFSVMNVCRVPEKSRKKYLASATEDHHGFAVE